MRWVRAVAAGAALASAVSGCTVRPQWVMMNPHSGALVDCDAPDMTAGPGEFLVSRACVSACQAHGFLPVPGAEARARQVGTPSACTD